MLLLTDEIEAGLDVEEQRGILDQVRELQTDQLGGTRLRLVATTNAPLVLGSAEPWFDPAQDRLCRMEQDAKTGESRCAQLTFVPHGPAGYWLTSVTSEVLGLQSDAGAGARRSPRSARSRRCAKTPASWRSSTPSRPS